MTENITTADEDASITKASILTKKQKIRSLPVVGKNGKLAGITNDRDLRGKSKIGAFGHMLRLLLGSHDKDSLFGLTSALVKHC